MRRGGSEVAGIERPLCGCAEILLLGEIQLDDPVGFAWPFGEPCNPCEVSISRHLGLLCFDQSFAAELS
jgi:hypothetical protein